MKLAMLLVMALAAALLSACGGSAHFPDEAAVVAGQSVSRSDVSAYVRYAYSFYHSTNGTTTGNACSRPDSSAVCQALGHQALARLLEERVVTTYARHHKIALGLTEKATVATQLQTLRNSDPTTQRLLRSHSVTLDFLSRLLTTETLVQTVERVVTSPEAIRGFSYHVQMYAIPIGATGSKARTYRKAERLATDGKPVPSAAIEHTRWVAAFRLPAALSRSLAAANNGDFVGPFRQGGHFLVVRRLDAGIHAYGRPAHQELETRLFELWLRSHMRIAGPRCFDTAGKRIRCPAVG